uniref:Uncharacterized protein n=1 Tax=Opuntia streptacantha TaxID=393608 RepID=A0A7C9DKW2_OPUST
MLCGFTLYAMKEASTFVFKVVLCAVQLQRLKLNVLLNASLFLVSCYHVRPTPSLQGSKRKGVSGLLRRCELTLLVPPCSDIFFLQKLGPVFDVHIRIYQLQVLHSLASTFFFFFS